MKRRILGWLGLLALVSGCGGRADRDGGEPRPGTEPPGAPSGGVDGSMAFGDGVQHSELSGVAYYEDFFVEGIALSVVPWGGAQCTVNGGHSPEFEWLGLAGHADQRFVTISLSGEKLGEATIWKVHDDEKGHGYQGVGRLPATLEGFQPPAQPGDTVSGRVTFTDPALGYEGSLTFSVKYCGSS